MKLGARCLDVIYRQGFLLGQLAGSLSTNESNTYFQCTKIVPQQAAHSLDPVLGHIQSVSPRRSRDTNQMDNHFIGCPATTEGDHSCLLHGA